MCAREPARDRPGAITSIGRPPQAPTIGEGPWRSSLPWSSGNSYASIRNVPASPDPPAFSAQRVHQLHGAFDQLCRLVDFFDRFGSIRVRDDDAVAAGEAVVTDLVP